MNAKKADNARLPTEWNQREASGKRVLNAEQVKPYAAIIDADAEQAEWEEYIRAPCRPCRDIIVAQERPYADADFEVWA